MSISSVAANLYATNARVGAGSLESGLQNKPQADHLTPDFGNMVTDAVTDFTQLGEATEAKQVDLLQGKANIVDVVTAVAETEVALETMVSMRDRVISAYEEIMRMPI